MDNVRRMIYEWGIVTKTVQNTIFSSYFLLLFSPLIFSSQNMVCNKNILTSNEEFYNNIETLLGNPAALQVPFYQRVNDKMGKIFVFGGYLNRSHITTTMEVYNRYYIARYGLLRVVVLTTDILMILLHTT